MALLAPPLDSPDKAKPIIKATYFCWLVGPTFSFFCEAHSNFYKKRNIQCPGIQRSQKYTKERMVDAHEPTSGFLLLLLMLLMFAALGANSPTEIICNGVLPLPVCF